jgi:rSAM/selenodomain-associated transferase 1
MPEIAVGLMARYPELGRVKTRLAKAAGDQRALVVYKALLSRACDLLSNLDRTTFHTVAFITPPNRTGAFQRDSDSFDSYLAQEGNELGEKMMRALESLLTAKHISKACLIGTDSPEIKTTILNVAGGFLDDHDLVLGPSLDGGYYLIGLRKVHSELFRGINWGTVTVLDETLAVADRLNLQVALLPQLRDLDDAEDLAYFVRTGLIE